MTEPSSELKDISLFWPRLFSLLAIAVATLPLLERLIAVLPTVLRYPNVAAALGSIVSLALIGSGYLKRRPVGVKEIQKAFKPLPTGVRMLLAGVVLIAGYVVYIDFLSQRSRETNSLEQSYLLLWYLASFALLARGFWQMAFRAYASEKKKSQLRELAKSRRT